MEKTALLKNKDETTKQKILLAATKLFAKKGFDGVSVREICKCANVNVSMVSYYFGGKKELYQAIIDDLIKKQTQYAITFVNFDMDLSKMSKRELVSFLHFLIDKFVDFMFSSVSRELLTFLIFEQQKQNATVNPPAFVFLKKIFARIFDKNENDKDIIFKILFLMGNIIAPRVLLHFSLKVLGQEDFKSDDIKIIKENAHSYINMIVKEVKVD